MAAPTDLSTLGELKAADYHVRSVKDEMRANLMAKLRAGEEIFPGIIGYDQTVIPQIQNAILAKHDLILLGLRGQAGCRRDRRRTGDAGSDGKRRCVERVARARTK